MPGIANSDLVRLDTNDSEVIEYDNNFEDAKLLNVMVERDYGDE